MAIDPALLNEKVEHGGNIRTGAYLSPSRNTAVVVRSKDGRVSFLTYMSGTVELREVFAFSFARDYPIFLPNYPAKRALRSFRAAGLPIHPLADKVFRAVLGG